LVFGGGCGWGGGGGLCLVWGGGLFFFFFWFFVVIMCVYPPHSWIDRGQSLCVIGAPREFFWGFLEREVGRLSYFPIFLPPDDFNVLFLTPFTSPHSARTTPIPNPGPITVLTTLHVAEQTPQKRFLGSKLSELPPVHEILENYVIVDSGIRCFSGVSNTRFFLKDCGCCSQCFQPPPAAKQKDFLELIFSLKTRGSLVIFHHGLSQPNPFPASWAHRPRFALGSCAPPLFQLRRRKIIPLDTYVR